METTVINEFQTTTSVAAKNLECLKNICEHLSEQLDYDISGPCERKKSNRFLEATLNGHKNSNRLCSVELSFDNETCQLTLMFNHKDRGNMLTTSLDMNDFNESMLNNIRMDTREWIYDKSLPISH